MRILLGACIATPVIGIPIYIEGLATDFAVVLAGFFDRPFLDPEVPAHLLAKVLYYVLPLARRLAR